jgi:phosphoribosylamine---glycine ligase
VSSFVKEHAFMRILVIGSGGREHAICRAFAKSRRTSKLYCANGNAGIAAVAECVGISPNDVRGLAAFASSNAIDLTFVGGETPLALGIVDEFESRGLNIIGPRRAAAQLESSKAFAKDFMSRHGVPTAAYAVAHTADFAVDELESGDLGDADGAVVVKADGLAAGKGVVVASCRAEAIAAIRDLEKIAGSEAAQKIVLEECLIGREISLLMFVNGEDFALMPPSRDHKRLCDGDIGPNTGGMGTITDSSLLTHVQLQMITDTIIHPTLHGCIREGFGFRGILFLGIMMTADGPKLLEYNVRFGDPETQAILIRLESDLADICESMLGNGPVPLAKMDINWRPGSSACVVMASRGYPTAPQIGDAIHGLGEAGSVPSVEVFHAGTTVSAGPEPIVVTAGGRVLGVTAVGDDLNAALSAAYMAVENIKFSGMQFRKDIGRTAPV